MPDNMDKWIYFTITIIMVGIPAYFMLTHDINSAFQSAFIFLILTRSQVLNDYLEDEINRETIPTQPPTKKDGD